MAAIFVKTMRCLLNAVLIAAVALISDRASAQRPGVAAYFPPPISAERFEQWMTSLNLSTQQRDAAMPLLHKYLERVEELQTGPMATLVSKITPGFVAPGIDAERTKLIARLAEFDEELLERLHEVCDEDQRPQFPGIREMRQRERLVNDLYLRAAGVPLIDVELLLADLRPGSEVLSAAHAALAGYGRTLLADLRRLEASTSRQRAETYELLKESGLDDAAFSQPGHMDRIRAVAEPIAQRFAPRYSQIHLNTLRLNRLALRQLDEAIPNRIAARLRTVYTRRVYPDLHFMQFEPAHLDDLLARATNAGVTADVIDQILRSFAQDLASLFEEATIAIDDMQHTAQPSDPEAMAKRSRAFEQHMIDCGERFHVHRQLARRALESAIKAEPAPSTQPATEGAVQ